jgi:hypothetical protein
MGRLLKIIAALSGVYGYRFEDGILEPICIPVRRDETGVFSAHVAALATDKRSNRTIAGTPIDDLNPEASVYYTFLAVTRAARKAQTPVVLGRPYDVSNTSRFGVQLAKLTPTTLDGLILADWRVEGHDAKKAGFTLKALSKAIHTYYQQ